MYVSPKLSVFRMKGTRIGIPIIDGNNITEIKIIKIVSLKWNSLYVNM